MQRVQPALEVARHGLALVWEWLTIQHVTALVLLAASASIIYRPTSLAFASIAQNLNIDINQHFFALVFGVGAGLLINGKVSQPLFNLATLPMAVYASAICTFTIIDQRSSPVVGVLIGGYWLSLQILHWRMAVSDGERTV